MFNIPSFFGFRAGSPFDPDAAAFFARVNTATGSSDFLTTTEKNAVNTLVIQMKTDLIWSSMKAIYPMVGGGTGTLAQKQAACEQNLVSSSFTGSFTSGWTFASTGVTPNGTSAFMDTTLQMQQLSHTTNHLSAYMRGSILNNRAILGVSDNLVTRYTILGAPASSNIFFNSYNALFLCEANITRTAFLFGTYISGNEKLFRNGTLQKTQLTTTTASTSTLPFYIGCFNSNGTASQFINQEISFSSLGDGLNDTEAGLFYNAVNIFQVALSRAV